MTASDAGVVAVSDADVLAAFVSDSATAGGVVPQEARAATINMDCKIFLNLCMVLLAIFMIWVGMPV
jgi:hypothetical protein